MRDNDDSRPLTGGETLQTMTIREVIADYDQRNIGIVHGRRYTWVHGYNVIPPSPGLGGTTVPSMVSLTDCYGNEIPDTYGHRDAKVQAVVAAL